MAAKFDSTASTANGTSASSINLTHVIGALGNTGLIVVGVIGKATNANYANTNVSTVLFNGVSMTKIKEDGSNAGSNGVHVSLWALWGSSVPAAGSYPITATYAGSCTSQAIGSMAFKFLKAQTAEANGSTNAAGTSPLSASLTTLTSSALLISIFGDEDGHVSTPTTGDSTGFQVAPGSGEASECDGYYRTIQVPGSATTTITVNNPQSEVLILGSFSISPTGILGYEI